MVRFSRTFWPPIAVATIIAACSSGGPQSDTSTSSTSSTSGNGGATGTTSASQGGGQVGGQGGASTTTQSAGAGGELDAGGPPPTEEDAGGFQPSDDWIFSDQVIHTVEITLPPESVSALDAMPFEFAQGDFVFDGMAVPKVGVRLRGKIGSFRTLAGKSKFKIEFGEIVEGQRFYGLSTLTLNNAVVDCSYLKEPLAYRVFALAGVPSERTGFARVSVNGADYGLYVIVETPDSRWLKRTYPEPKGTLYDGKYIWFGGNNYQLLDFANGVDDMFQLEEGMDVGHADIHALSAAVAASFGTPQFGQAVAPLLDWAEYHRELAAEQWVGHNDGYALNSNNYRVYFNPADGKAQIVPWDFDYGFLHDSDWGMNWASPLGRLAKGCFLDPSCAADHKVAVKALIDAIDPVALLAWFDQIDALTYAETQDDPRRECGAGEVGPWRDYLRDFITNQNAALTGFWGL